MKIDLHLHSKFSTRPTQWVLQKIGAPESFSRPGDLYRLTRKLGMDAMTLTDHNTIMGCLEIAHLPGVFISEEVTTYFPEDGCKMHVLCHRIDEKIHGEIARRRENVYDLVAYLNREKVSHALAHPLYPVNHMLSLEHLEKMLLLFKVLELNGTRDESQNRLLRVLAANLTPELMEQLSDQHDLAPSHAQPWRKILIGGSDDHSSLNVARVHTRVPEAQDLDQFFAGLAAGRGLVGGEGSEPATLAHNLYGIAYQYFHHRFNLDKYVNNDVLMRFLENMLRPEPKASNWLLFKLSGLWNRRARRRPAESEKVQEVFRREGTRMIREDPHLQEIISRGCRPGERKDQAWLRFVSQAGNRVLFHLGEKLFGQITGGNVFNLFNTIGAAGTSFFLMAPYFVSYGLFSRDRKLAQEVRQRFIPCPGEPERTGREPRVAHFTDTFHDVNGVALTLQRQAAVAESTGKELTLVTCAQGQPAQKGRVRNFAPVAVYQLPEYPQQDLCLPPFLEILDYVYQEGFTHLHAATPGPMGLAALAVARILQLPISGTYHTAFPQYAAQLTGDQGLEEMIWRYILWYYDQMGSIYVPSQDTGAELTAKGIAPGKIRLYPRGVDLEAFSPAFAGDFFARRYQMDAGLKLLYVGRVSKEKNLHLLAEAFRNLARNQPRLQLVVVGDGPYLEKMKRRLQGLSCLFTGYLRGRDLAQAYASSDLFVFPSTTDTFGNVILEAQASGLPVVVSDAGGPRENMLPGRTGLVTPGGDAQALAQAILSLSRDQSLRARMGRDARAYMETRSFTKAFLQHWEMYAQDGQEVPPPLDQAGLAAA